MKKVIKTIFALIIFSSMLNVSFAARPTYKLTAQNFVFRAANELVFDIYILHTNIADTVFQYALGQYYFNFDTNFCAGGTISYDFAPSATGDSSDFFFNARPRTPTRVGSQLRLNTNNALGLGNGPIVSGVIPGSKVIRMRLRTSAPAFSSNSPADLQLRWRNANAGNPFTKIFAYVGNLNTEITDSTGHFIDIPTGIQDPGSVASILPKDFSLSQNFPNPFNPTTKIEFALPVSGNVNLLIYDITGREIINLVNEAKAAGYYSVQFNASNLASGMYFYRLRVQGDKNYDVTRKMMLIK
ncbi:MAG: T9SS type A sorting domain-containing protein [Ignavibacteria bacterium]|nr:T9SS type A sorting domain-containing protein [Ignavibacteria bacterium]